MTQSSDVLGNVAALVGQGVPGFGITTLATIVFGDFLAAVTTPARGGDSYQYASDECAHCQRKRACGTLMDGAGAGHGGPDRHGASSGVGMAM